MEQTLLEALMNESIEESKKSVNEDEGIHPKVGAILSDEDGKIILRAHRGETGYGNHCEYIILEKAKGFDLDFDELILFVTLEPCTKRGPNKIPCAMRIVQSGIKKVYIGVLDDNPLIRGSGEAFLRDHLQVERFPHHLIERIKEINRDFIDQYKKESLPDTSLFVSKQISDIMLEYLQRKGYTIDRLSTDWDLTLDDIIIECRDKVAERHHFLPESIFEALGYAYDKKYSDYTYEKDYRGLNNAWVKEIRDIFSILNLSKNLANYDVIDVGVGNGLEIKPLFDHYEKLTLVDIAKESVLFAKRNLPKARVIVSPADDIVDIKDDSQDIYLSLRTYQSTYFDINAALKEATRILKPNGVLLISIANGFLDDQNNLVSGLVIPKTKHVDRNRPYDLANQVRRKLSLYRYENIGVRTGIGEIYVYGRRGG